jgi:hypothetical protein
MTGNIDDAAYSSGWPVHFEGGGKMNRPKKSWRSDV